MKESLERNRSYKVVIDGYDQSLVSACSLASDFFKRLKGLMFRNELEDDEGLLIYPCNSVHTYFMKFPIDLVFMDVDGVIVHEIRRVNPGRVLKPISGAWGTLELKGGRLEDIGASDSTVGRKLRFESV